MPVRTGRRWWRTGAITDWARANRQVSLDGLRTGSTPVGGMSRQEGLEASRLLGSPARRQPRSMIMNIDADSIYRLAARRCTAAVSVKQRPRSIYVDDGLTEKFPKK